MLRRLRPLGLAAGLALTVSVCLTAAVLTDDLGTMKRGPLEKVQLEDSAVWDEYGLEEAETAKYEGRGTSFTATAWRFRDPTGSQAAFRWQRPVGARTAPEDFAQYSQFAVAAGDTILMTHGNYLLRITGGKPNLDELKILLFQMPNLDQSSLPPVLDYVPKKDLVAGSDRFISGPASIEKFFPKVSPATAGFHFGTEAVVARYRMPSGETEMAVFYYPTNPMARDRQPEFEKIAGSLVKRTGPLLAVVIAPPNADDAQRLLSQVNYRATVTLNQNPSQPEQNAGDMLLAIFSLIGLLLLLCLFAGGMMFGIRAVRRYLAGGKEEEAMTMLHLDDHQQQQQAPPAP